MNRLGFALLIVRGGRTWAWFGIKLMCPVSQPFEDFVEELTWFHICSCNQVQKGTCTSAFSLWTELPMHAGAGKGSWSCETDLVVFILNIEIPLQLKQILRIFVYSFQIKPFKENYMLSLSRCYMGPSTYSSGISQILFHLILHTVFQSIFELRNKDPLVCSPY